MNTIIFWLKKLHILPVYRIDVLRYARENKKGGFCWTLRNALNYFFIPATRYQAFPLFTYRNAKKFGADGEEYWYWWELGVWNTGRLDFLDWLIEQYKNDKTDLRKMKED